MRIGSSLRCEVRPGTPRWQHNFVWGAQQPGWIAGPSQTDQRAEVGAPVLPERGPDFAMFRNDKNVKGGAMAAATPRR
jgi:hypothetical protein